MPHPLRRHRLVFTLDISNITWEDLDTLRGVLPGMFPGHGKLSAAIAEINAIMDGLLPIRRHIWVDKEEHRHSFTVNLFTTLTTMSIIAGKQQQQVMAQLEPAAARILGRFRGVRN
jgi:hypothetical protein